MSPVSPEVELGTEGPAERLPDEPQVYLELEGPKRTVLMAGPFADRKYAEKFIEAQDLPQERCEIVEMMGVAELKEQIRVWKLKEKWQEAVAKGQTELGLSAWAAGQ